MQRYAGIQTKFQGKEKSSMKEIKRFVFSKFVDEGVNTSKTFDQLF